MTTLSREDQKQWQVMSVNLSDTINFQKGETPSRKRTNILETHYKGYSAIQLSSVLYDRLSDGLIQETLSNMVRYSRASNYKGSTFVFQEKGKKPSAPILSETRLI
jgi:hypothetical protein